MKRIFSILFLMVLFSGYAFAAGTVTGSSERFGYNNNFLRNTYTVTFDESAASPANVALDSISAGPGETLHSVSGYMLLRVDIYPGATGPTDNTDFYVWSVEDKIDILGNNGLNAIDNATNSSFYPATVSQPLTGNEIFDIDNNAVNNAGCVVIFTMYK